MLIDIEKLICSQDIQSRETINTGTVQDYAEAMRDGAIFPPVTVFEDSGEYWVADGFHRVEAYKTLGTNEVECDVRKGGKTDALIFSCGSNATHGLQRTNTDKRRSVLLLLANDRFKEWSTRQIAEACKVSHTFVAKVQKELRNANDTPENFIQPTYPWDRDSFKEECATWNDSFHGSAFAMDLLGYSLETIADTTGKDIEDVERLFNPQYANRCKPFRKTVDRDGDENDNYSRGETLIGEGYDENFFRTAYNATRKKIVHSWRRDAWRMSAIILRHNPALSKKALDNYANEDQRRHQLQATLDGLGLESGLGFDGMVCTMSEIKAMEVVTKEDFYLYAHFAFLDSYVRQDARWACGYSNKEPVSNWLARGRFTYECVEEVWDWWSCKRLQEESPMSEVNPQRITAFTRETPGTEAA